MGFTILAKRNKILVYRFPVNESPLCVDILYYISIGADNWDRAASTGTPTPLQKVAFGRSWSQATKTKPCRTSALAFLAVSG